MEGVNNRSKFNVCPTLILGSRNLELAGERQISEGEVFINLDDRDINRFSLNPSCNASFYPMHDRSWVVHHIRPEVMECMWAVDVEAAAIAAAAAAPHDDDDEAVAATTTTMEEG